jgi:hypothetical protein
MQQKEKESLKEETKAIGQQVHEEFKKFEEEQRIKKLK